MAASGWDPFKEITGLQERLDRIFRDIHTTRSVWEFTSSDWTPAVDIIDAGDVLVIKMEVPEVERETIDITIAGSELTVRGKRRLEHGTDGSQYLTMERGYGSFSRSFPFSGSIDTSEISASIEDGVLRIELPKKEFKPKQIIIES